jgi:hypothetical protein
VIGTAYKIALNYNVSANHAVSGGPLPHLPSVPTPLMELASSPGLQEGEKKKSWYHVTDVTDCGQERGLTPTHSEYVNTGLPNCCTCSTPRAGS